MRYAETVYSFNATLFDDDLSFCLKWKTNVKALGYCTNFKVRPELTDALQDKSQAGVLVQGQDI